MRTHVITEEAMQGLDGAISKWRGQVATIGGGEPECPLCLMFDKLEKWSTVCIGCPIYADTGRTKCEGTPYYTWIYSKTLDKAQAELDYLIDLKSRCTVEAKQ